MDQRVMKGIIYAVFGVLLISLSIEGMMSVIMLLIGAATVIINIMKLSAVSSIRTSGKKTMMIISVIGIILGVCLMIFRNSALAALIGLYMIVLPIVDVFMSKYKTEQLKAGLPKILFGVVLVAVGPGKALEIISDVAGLALVVLGVMYIVKALVGRKIR